MKKSTSRIQVLLIERMGGDIKARYETGQFDITVKL